MRAAHREVTGIFGSDRVDPLRIGRKRLGGARQRIGQQQIHASGHRRQRELVQRIAQPERGHLNAQADQASGRADRRTGFKAVDACSQIGGCDLLTNIGLHISAHTLGDSARLHGQRDIAAAVTARFVADLVEGGQQ